jgi:hypothetical protein
MESLLDQRLVSFSQTKTRYMVDIYISELVFMWFWMFFWSDEWSGVEWSGVEWSGVEWSGVE